MDYMIGSEELFNNIMYFNVLEKDDSDHVPIACRLAFDVDICKQEINTDQNQMLCKDLPRFKWNVEFFLSLVTKFGALFSQTQ